MLHELIIVLTVSLIIAVFRKRKIINIENTEIKGLSFFAASFFLQFISNILFSRFSEGIVGVYIYSFFPIIHCLSYQLILIGAVINFEKNYMKIFFTGTMLNFIVILFNGMKMPVKIPLEHSSSWENYSYLAYGKDLIHTIMTEDTKFKFLADIIILDSPYPFKKTISIGDIFLLLGFGWFIQEETKKSPKR